ncbi:hypothetical protein P3X46_034453 [Hevea brasiliensis]|uniref:Ribosomal RNA-processing protein 14/surfeit locus protein 6 C-terminal domain-containing protein n=1 Tax=Hevea brasiliensis TaxID=3981 RepID=A0ABQ9K7Z7_HEVBR|nr:hypothetical protein P3X46_034453 [Hevea brasiliensis]
MKKRHNPVNAPSPDIDLKYCINQNSVFFDKLIELIPAKFYLPIKRLDPDKSSTTTLDRLMKILEKEKSSDESIDEGLEINPMMSGLEDNDRRVTYEELRQRLRHKIDELRRGQNNDGLDKQKKRKRDSESEEKKPTKTSVEKVEKDVEEVKELKFSHVKLGNKEGQEKKKRKLSKLKELQKAKELEEAKDPVKADIISKKHLWKAATSRAAGVKVHDDQKRLKQNIQKEKKRHQKSVEKWKERIVTQQKMKAEKQQTRSHNRAEGIHQKRCSGLQKERKSSCGQVLNGEKMVTLTTLQLKVPLSKSLYWYLSL